MSNNDKPLAIKLFLEMYWNDNGYSPSLREIADGLGLSTTAIKHHMDNLADSGEVKTPRNGRWVLADKYLIQKAIWKVTNGKTDQ